MLLLASSPMRGLSICSKLYWKRLILVNWSSLQKAAFRAEKVAKFEFVNVLLRVQSFDALLRHIPPIDVFLVLCPKI